MIALRCLGAGWRLLQGRILFERFVIDLDAPPFLEELRDLVVGKRQVAGHQITDAGRTVLVCEDLFDQKHWERDAFQPNFAGRVCR